MSFPRYPKYKDSGVEWLGQVPEHWEVKQLQYVAEINPSKSEIASLKPETLVSFLPMEAIGDDGSLELARERRLGEVSGGYTYFRNGDIGIAKITPCFENGKGAIMRGLRNEVGFGTTELVVLRPRPELISTTFVWMLLRSESFQKLGEAHLYGAGGQKRVPESFVKKFMSAFPPLQEQCAIARFLTAQVEKINILLAEQRRLISLLREKQQSIAFRAVTKGLDPDASLKQSGLYWADSIPEHWRAVRLGQYASVENGTTPDRANQAYWKDGTVPWLSSGEVNQGSITSAAEMITEEALAECSLRLLPPGTTVVGMIGEGRTRGLAAITRISAVVNQNLAAIVPSEGLDPQYLLYVTRAMYEYIREQGRGGNQAALNCRIISELRIPLPPIEEQRTISAWLEQRDEESLQFIEDAQRAIALLREYRTALISAAVTGKIDVRNYAADQAEAA